jgi:hypothetical protein
LSARRPVPLILAFALLLLAVPLAACGDEEGDVAEALPPPSLEQWQARVDGYCSDGIQEAVALPLPTNSRQLPNDARARAEILITVRDAVLPLARPEGKQDTVDSWLDELTADAEQLSELAATAAAGGDFLSLEPVDESAGAVALVLGLRECAALANAIARTP